MRFRDRDDAALRLAALLEPLDLEHPVVLGIPRGGVVVADRLAEVLGGTMDVVLVRKLGAPGNPEFALGAVTEEGDIVQQPYAERFASPAYLRAEVARQLEVLRERARRYRAVRPKVPLKDRDVVLVDDGVATGSTLEAAHLALQKQGPARVVMAAPVASPEAAGRLGAQGEWVAVLIPADFTAVGAYYESFDQVTDEEVVARLSRWGAREA
ncbi:phosphoribosyltransferase [Marinithermus hydrothermalis]|uniref:Phosphoribosyltransferase n=1 Tax=Marinithermus hydrothermalis (strain DSM 14884 / JCM 11576 / T1) TaxID=869210 RepID=F2NQE7_MARHT|nr:phosphoribosyltransferase family protein [Marinithermus hydrothermalis]AEB11674.1 phosphoribosyltransferase [Marinithermus hydrothermalis DSM 14884]